MELKDVMEIKYRKLYNKTQSMDAVRVCIENDKQRVRDILNKGHKVGICESCSSITDLTELRNVCEKVRKIKMSNEEEEIRRL